MQDDWRISPSVTLNLGVRYELETGLTEASNKIVRGFETTTPNPIQAAAQANFTGSPPAGVPTTFNVLGNQLFSDDSNRTHQKTDKNNIQPRIGVD